jgi:cytochrome bd-type quinol oxidase subunit 2
MYYQWILLLHIVSVLALLGTHGTSMVVLYRIRAERDRKKIFDLISLSGETTIPMYVSIGAIVVTGILLGVKLKVFSHWWVWLAIVLLVAIVGLMTAIAKPYFKRVKAACEVRPSGVPRVSDEELGDILRSPSAHVITAIGVIGLVAILYLMVFQPGVV